MARTTRNGLGSAAYAGQARADFEHDRSRKKTRWTGWECRPLPVNQRVAGSSPAPGAIWKRNPSRKRGISCVQALQSRNTPASWHRSGTILRPRAETGILSWDHPIARLPRARVISATRGSRGCEVHSRCRSISGLSVRRSMNSRAYGRSACDVLLRTPTSVSSTP